MTLIIGGAYQGKRDYALNALGCAPEKIVEHVERLILEMLRQGKNPLTEIERLVDTWQESVVLLEDISCGVVPVDAEERAWREAAGRCGVYLASRAECVIRVFCGIGTVIRSA